MRIVALVKGLEHACCRYRIAALRPFLESADHSLEVYPWPKSFWSRLTLRRRLQGRDVLVLQRKMPSPRQLGQFRDWVRHLIFDFDDAIFLRDSFHAQGQYSSRRAQRFRGVVQNVDAVVAGNEFLREQASLWVASDRIHLIPTCVDPGRYAPAAHELAQATSELVWIGSASTLRGLERARPLLEKIGRCLPGLRLKIVCDQFLDLEHLQVKRSLWSERTEAAELASAQIGFSWLPDDLWSRGKCGLKVLQYMAAGLPVVANPVGVQKELVIHGKSGFLVESAAECVAAIRLLAASPLLRQRMGMAGRELAQRSYSAAGAGVLWLHLLDRFRPTAQRVTLAS